MTETIRLSAAIRQGATQGRQLFGSTFGSDGASCALGAALLGIGKTEGEYINVLDHFFTTVSKEVSHPMVVGGGTCLMITVIRELNDHYKWSRERIADWVETQEAE